MLDPCRTVRYDFVILASVVSRAKQVISERRLSGPFAFYIEAPMIQRIVERYCTKQANIINKLKKENKDACLADSSYENSLPHHRRKQRIMIATTKYNTAIELFLKDSKFKKIEVEL